MNDLQIINDWITSEQEIELLSCIESGDWELSLKRRVQQFGPVYNYSTRKLDPTNKDIPSWLDNTLIKLEEHFKTKPNQIIVNEYKIKQTISKHIDSPLFGPVIASLSLKNEATMNIGTYDGREMSFNLLPRSLIVFSGEARNKWWHSIPPVLKDRISITFRTIK